MKEHLEHHLFHLVSEVADKMQLRVYVIGGYVRDLLLQRSSKDVDFVVIGSGIKLAEGVAVNAGTASPKVFENFGTAMLMLNDWQLEFVGARKESYRRHSRKPIVEDGTLEDDQHRRDFTINAMAIGLNKENFGELLDPFNGMNDLKERIIRTPLDPDVTFSDDPLRMMRAIRFATELDFNIFNGTYNAIKKNAERIGIVSKERIVEELNRMIAADKPSIGFKLLLNTGLLKFILPEMVALRGTEYIDGRGHKDNFWHTLEVLDNVALKSENLWLRWGVLLHDIAKPETKRYDKESGWTFHAHEFVGAKMVPRIFRRLKLPLNEKMKFVQKLVLLHLRPIALTEETVTDSAIRRLLFEAGEDLEDLMILCEADITSKNPAKVKKYLKNFRMVRKKLKEVEAKDRIRNWQPPISGEIIMHAFDLIPGRTVGDIKNAIREAILDGIIGNDFDEAFDLMINEGEKAGLKLIHNRDEFLEEKNNWSKCRDDYTG